MASEDLYLLSRSEIKELTGWNDIVVDDYLAISESVESILRPEGWHIVGASGEPAFQNGWANMAGEAIAAFYIDASNIVRLKGAIDTGINVTTAFTLPESYWPDEIMRLSADRVNTIGAAKVTVDTSGNVIPTNGNTNGISLTGLSYRING